MKDLIYRQDAIDAIITEGRTVDSRYLESERILHESDAVEAISMLPSAEPWDIVKTALKELEQKEERIYSDYCDATARLKAIDKIAKSNQTMKQKIDGIVPLAEQEVEDDY